MYFRNVCQLYRNISFIRTPTFGACGSVNANNFTALQATKNPIVTEMETFLPKDQIANGNTK